jgi:hypothetical protein
MRKQNEPKNRRLRTLKMIDKIKEIEEKLNNNLALNDMEGKFNLNTIKKEMNNLIELECVQ